MKKVNLYIESDSAAFQKKERQCGYVLEYIKDSTPITREGFRKGRGTYNQEIMRTLIEALNRIREPCELCIYAGNRFVLNMLQDKLALWAGEGFTSNGRPVMNQEEWRRIWELIKEHKVSTQIGEHTYSKWLLAEMEDRDERTREKQDTGHTAGAGQEGSTGTHGGDLQET